MAPTDYQLFYQRRLPHYQPPGAIVFSTFRLAGSLPEEILERLDEEARRKDAEIEHLADLYIRNQTIYDAQKQLFGRWDIELDANHPGPHWLAEPDVAKLVCDALHYRDGREYTLEAYAIMPNHVHMVFSPIPISENSVPLSKIMHSLKGYTARKANITLNRQGDFWQHESYDHVIRDNEEFNRIVDYVLDNPVRAGLQTRWVYRKK